MLQPVGVTEQLMFSTVQLIADNGDCGTGFFFNFRIDNSTVPVIITNKHVVNNNPYQTMTFMVHLSDDGKSSGENAKIRFNTYWKFHPEHDLCYTYCQPLIDDILKKTKKHVFFKGLSLDIIYDEEKLKTLSAVEEILMVGYPTGLYDASHNYPIFRHGYTAAHPGYDFNDKDIGLIDAACFPGSSGSPVFIYNKGSYSDRPGAIMIGERLIFLGILYAGPHFNTEGVVIPKIIPMRQVPMAQIQIPTNLGYYIKAHTLKKFEQIIRQDLDKQKEQL